MLHLKWQLLVSRHTGSSGKWSTIPQRWIWSSLWMPTAERELNRHLSHILFLFFCLFVAQGLVSSRYQQDLKKASVLLKSHYFLLHSKRNHFSFHFHPTTVKLPFYNLHNWWGSADSRVQWASQCIPHLQTLPLGNSFPRVPAQFPFKSFRPSKKETGCQISNLCSLDNTHMVLHIYPLWYALTFYTATTKALHKSLPLCAPTPQF